MFYCFRLPQIEHAFAYLEKLHVRKPSLRFAYAYLDLG